MNNTVRRIRLRHHQRPSRALEAARLRHRERHRALDDRQHRPFVGLFTVEEHPRSLELAVVARRAAHERHQRRPVPQLLVHFLLVHVQAVDERQPHVPLRIRFPQGLPHLRRDPVQGASDRAVNALVATRDRSAHALHHTRAEPQRRHPIDSRRCLRELPRRRAPHDRRPRIASGQRTRQPRTVPAMAREKDDQLRRNTVELGRQRPEDVVG